MSGAVAAVVAVAVLFADASTSPSTCTSWPGKTGLSWAMGMIAYHLFYTIVTLGERDTCR